MSDVYAMRQMLHKKVEDGMLYDAMVETGKTFGFKDFRMVGFGPASRAVTVSGEKKVFIGAHVLDDLRKIAKSHAGVVENYIEHVMEGLSGLASFPELKTRQKKAGMDIYGEEAARQRRSQSNLHAAVRCHTGRTFDGLMKVIASNAWYKAVYPIYDMLERDVPECWRDDTIKDQTRAYMEFAGYPWLNPDGLERIVDDVLHIDQEYQKKLHENDKPFVFVVTVNAGTADKGYQVHRRKGPRSDE